MSDLKTYFDILCHLLIQVNFAKSEISVGGSNWNQTENLIA